MYVGFTLYAVGISGADAFTQMGKIVSFWDEKGQEVEGAFQAAIDDQTVPTIMRSWQLRWQPKTLAPGECRVTIDTSKAPGPYYGTPPLTHHFFHVGSLPRVREVSFLADKGGLLKVLLVFSEYVDLTKIGNSLKLTDVTTSTVLSPTLTSTGTKVVAVAFTVPASKGLNGRYSLVVGKDVGADSGLELDGKYTGKPGSGDFVLDVEPAALATKTGSDDRVWRPTLNLPGM